MADKKSAPKAAAAPADVIIDTTKYVPVEDARAIVNVKKEVGDDLTNDYMSLSSVHSFLRKRPAHVQKLLDDIAAKHTVNGPLIHESLNVGTLSIPAFFLTEKEAERTRFSVKQYLNILVRVAKSPFKVEDIAKLKSLKVQTPDGELKVRYLHQVPAEVIKAYTGK